MPNPTICRHEHCQILTYERSGLCSQHEALWLNPPWLADAAEALGEVRPDDGAPLALNWTQVIQGIRELREDRDTLLKISRIVNGALNGESPLDREQRATKALHLVAEALGRPA